MKNLFYFIIMDLISEWHYFQTFTISMTKINAVTSLYTPKLYHYKSQKFQIDTPPYQKTINPWDSIENHWFWLIPIHHHSNYHYHSFKSSSATTAVFLGSCWGRTQFTSSRILINFSEVAGIAARSRLPRHSIYHRELASERECKKLTWPDRSGEGLNIRYPQTCIWVISEGGSRALWHSGGQASGDTGNFFSGRGVLWKTDAMAWVWGKLLFRKLGELVTQVCWCTDKSLRFFCNVKYQIFIFNVKHLEMQCLIQINCMVIKNLFVSFIIISNLVNYNFYSTFNSDAMFITDKLYHDKKFIRFSFLLNIYLINYSCWS